MSQTAWETSCAVFLLCRMTPHSVSPQGERSSGHVHLLCPLSHAFPLMGLRPCGCRLKTKSGRPSLHGTSSASGSATREVAGEICVCSSGRGGGEVFCERVGQEFRSHRGEEDTQVFLGLLR